MQSGRGNIDKWVLECESTAVRRPEPLMGWTESGDTLAQVHLEFDQLENAVDFAEKKGFTYNNWYDGHEKPFKELPHHLRKIFFFL